MQSPHISTLIRAWKEKFDLPGLPLLDLSSWHQLLLLDRIMGGKIEKTSYLSEQDVLLQISNYVSILIHLYNGSIYHNFEL